MSARAPFVFGLLLGCFGCGAQSDKPKNAGDLAKPAIAKQSPETPKTADEGPKVAAEVPKEGIKVVAFDFRVDDVEGDVRSTIAKRFKVDPMSIALDKPISDPPLKADESQLREIVMTLEERRGIEISEFALDAFINKGPTGAGKADITPAQLSALVRLAPKLHPSKMKKTNPPDGK